MVAVSGSGRELNMTFDVCRDVSFYAGAAAESRSQGVPWVAVFNNDVRAADSDADLRRRIIGLRIGYGDNLSPDEAAALAYDLCLQGRIN